MRKKEIFIVDDVTRYLVSMITKEEKIPKVQFYNQMIIEYFRPSIPSFNQEYEYLIQRMNGKINSKEEITEYEIRQAIGRVLSYGKNVQPLREIQALVPFLFKCREVIDDIILYQQQEKELSRQYGNPEVMKDIIERIGGNVITKAKAVCKYWSNCWHQDWAYDVLLDAVYQGELKQELTPWDAINWIKSMDRICITEDILMSEQSWQREKIERGNSYV